MFAAWLHEMGYDYFTMGRLTWPEIRQLQHGVALMNEVRAPKGAPARADAGGAGRTRPRKSDTDKLQQFNQKLGEAA